MIDGLIASKLYGTATQRTGKSSKPFSAATVRIITPGTLRVRRYRKQHPRIDFIPSPDVWDIIQHHLATSGDPCLAGVLDGLIRMGHKAVSGNGGKL